jgi:hypothetical protein
MAETPRPTKLLDRVRERLRLKHYSLRTEQAYLHWIRRYIVFFGKRHPETMGDSELTEFLTTSRWTPRSPLRPRTRR